ncbi:hypothetical protein FQN57_002178 [Myotisia sp. PD_48]|nr:hypothetical protein FQN57_002178 [Myotisia sp. PD_48]
MALNVEGFQQVLRKLVIEVHDQDDGDLEPCVICLEQIHDTGIAIPCKHASFDFQCLVTWLGERPACPLCQAIVTGVKYDIHVPGGEKVFWLPSRPAVNADSAALPGHWPRTGRIPRVLRRVPVVQDRQDTALNALLSRRRHIYRHDMYSLRVGSNPISNYREVTPQMIDADPKLLSKARNWIRRELQLFTYLNAGLQPGHTASHSHQQDLSVNSATSPSPRRIENPEFLLEYIIAMIRTVEIKGSGGQAEQLLREFFGTKHTRLFLHELQSWLRSPFDTLKEWDDAVQYMFVQGPRSM